MPVLPAPGAGSRELVSLSWLRNRLDPDAMATVEAGLDEELLHAIHDAAKAVIAEIDQVLQPKRPKPRKKRLPRR